MDKMNPDFYIHTGDIEYMDKPNPYALTEELMRFKWNRIFSLPFQRSFYNKYTSYFMKDDHDIGFNDSYPGKDYGTVPFERGLEIFDKEQFPSYKKDTKLLDGVNIYRFGSLKDEIIEVQIILRMDQKKQFGGNIKKNGSMKQLKIQMQLLRFWLHPHQFLVQIRLEKMIT